MSSDARMLGDIDEILGDWIFQNPPEVLFHYTDQMGLLGMVRDREQWATNVQYLNDRREFQHAVELANRLISARMSSESDSDRRRHLSYLTKGISRVHGVSTCVASWSASEDDLSQWRAYSKGGTGYCLAFASATLRELARKQTYDQVYLFAKCVYDAADQENLMGRIIDATVANTMEWDLAGQDWMIAEGHHMALRLVRYGALFKDEAFASEQEWRLVSPVLTVISDFRPGQSNLIPYCRFSLDAKRSSVSVDVAHVRVGPCPNPELAQNAVTGMLATYAGIHNFQVLLSAVPFRTW